MKEALNSAFGLLIFFVGFILVGSLSTSLLPKAKSQQPLFPPPPTGVDGGAPQGVDGGAPSDFPPPPPASRPGSGSNLGSGSGANAGGVMPDIPNPPTGLPKNLPPSKSGDSFPRDMNGFDPSMIPPEMNSPPPTKEATRPAGSAAPAGKSPAPKPAASAPALQNARPSTVSAPPPPEQNQQPGQPAPPPTNMANPTLPSMSDPSTFGAADPSMGAPLEMPVITRDPFLPLVKSENLKAYEKNEAKKTDAQSVDSYLKSTDPMLSQPLENYQLISVLWDVSDPKAMLKSSEGKVFLVRKKTMVGREASVVLAIRESEVLFLQPGPDFKYEKGTVRTMPMRK